MAAGMAHLATALCSNTSIVCLEVPTLIGYSYRNQIGVEGTRHLAKYLSMSTCLLQDLDVRFNCIKEDGLLALLQAINSRDHMCQSHLLTLNLEQN